MVTAAGTVGLNVGTLLLLTVPAKGQDSVKGHVLVKGQDSVKGQVPVKGQDPIQGYKGPLFQKDGTCPEILIRCAMLNPPNRCGSDTDCPGNKKCCVGSCGMACMNPQ
ncbi:elafin [Loxodonta africana]|uniref:elafin n=1 Tax=Loxodonta africana TaxID=9785 RepID=UPI0030CB84CF